MDLLIPEAGTIFWTILIFSIAVFIMAKFAWKPVLKGLKERDSSIALALKAAETARNQVSELHSESEKLMAEARVERDKIIQEARQFKESLMADAREQAKKEGHKLIEEAREAIKNERNAAIFEIKKQVTELSVAISEKLLLQELSDPARQQALIEKSLNEVKFN